MNLRKATLEDFEKIYPIYMDKTVNPYMDFPLMSKEDFFPLFKKFVDELLVHEKGDDILVLVSIKILPFRNSHVAYIDKLAVNPDFQNSGLGRELFDLIIPQLKEKGIKRLDLRVESDNHNAIKFYQKIGFQIEGTLKDYFNREGDLIDNLIMAMPIA